jgi:alkaline phosphatase D
LIDDAGHTFGPASGELTDKLKEADKLLGDLMNGIKKDVNLPINLIVVSDHGMQELTYKPDTYVFLDEIIDVKDTSINIVNNGTHAHLYVKNKVKIDSLVKVLSTNSDLKVYRSQDFPPRWHYQNSRSGDIFITAEPSKEITLKSREKIKATMKPGSHWGVHGYDPDVVKDMSGIFYASGPNIKQGIVLPPFRNIHIYPLVATILQLKIPAIDGSADVLKSIYRP